MKANKRLGQNFLKNKSFAELIIDTAEPCDGDFFIEIGPGRGELTTPLLKRSKTLENLSYRGVEKDPELARILGERLKKTENGDVSVITGDIRDMEFGKITSEKAKMFKLIGNIPYYLSGQLFRALTESAHKPSTAVLMIQKEVAERLTAKEGKMNRLAALIGFWYDSGIILTIGKRDFFPSPKVDSAVLRLTLKKNAEERTQYWKIYEEFVKKIFIQPRKTIENNLRAGEPDNENAIREFLKKNGLSGSARAQELSVVRLVEISQIWKKEYANR